MKERKGQKKGREYINTSFEVVKIEDLYTDPANLRVHNERSIEELKASLAHFGQQKPIVIAKDGKVIAGNGTLEAAKRLGWTTLAAVRNTDTAERQAAFAVADNRTAELSSWDFEELGNYLSDSPPELQVGFSEKEVSQICGVAAAEGSVSGVQSSREIVSTGLFEHTCPKCGFEFS